MCVCVHVRDFFVRREGGGGMFGVPKIIFLDHPFFNQQSVAGD